MAGDIEGVVGTAVQEPSAVLVLLCSVAMVPEVILVAQYSFRYSLRKRGEGQGYSGNVVEAKLNVVDKYNADQIMVTG